MTLNGDAPTIERGTAVSTVYNWTGVLPWSQFMDDAEKAPDLQWPRSVEWYDQMRNDAQCQGLYLGATAALRRYAWYIDPNGCDPAYVNLLAADFNLVVGEDVARVALAEGNKSARLRSSGRFSWYNHLAMLLRALYYGHFYFEQVGTITNDGPGGREVWRLRKLAPRHPRTITEIKVADDGGLVSITQGYGKAGQPPPEIPVDNLVAYIWDQDPGNWVGRSIYRPMYRNWLVKDRLLRVDAIKHERNGVGMPIVEAPPGATKADILELDAMAQEYKAGERGGGAVPNQTRLRLVGTEGSIPDTIGSIRFHNEEMARSMLMMFMQLGQTETGSRALGQSFIDWFAEQQTYIADWAVGVTVEHAIEDWWGWNVDPAAEQTPLLGYVRDEDGGTTLPTAGDFAGAQLPPEVAAGLRRSAPSRSRKPRSRVAADEFSPGALPGAGDSPNPQSPAPAVSYSLPMRKLHRRPYAHEIQASADFGGIEEDTEAGQRNADETWNSEQLNLMDWLREKMASAEEAAAAGAAFYDIRREVHEQAFAKAADEAFAATMADTSNVAAERAWYELFRQGFTWKRAGVGALGLFVATPADELLIAGAIAYGVSMRDTIVSNAERLTSRVQASYTSAQELSQKVYDDIMGRSAPWTSDQTRAMVQGSVNRSRVQVFGEAQKDADIDLYASELLDINTCPACAYIDGDKLTATEAHRLYAAGGYIDCDGGPRCRGTVVAVYNGERSY